MKLTKLILAFILVLNNSVYGQIYSRAFTYIKFSSHYLKTRSLLENKDEPICIKVVNETIPLELSSFVEELKSSYILDSLVKIKKDLNDLDLENYFEPFENYKYVENANSCLENCYLFFSKINNNFLMGDLFFNIKNNNSKYKNLIVFGSCYRFLFQLDNRGEIVEIYVKQIIFN